MNTDLKKLRNEFMNHVRVLEYADRQVVSLLEIHGIEKQTIQALWEIGIPTTDALVACDMEVLLAGLRSSGVSLGNEKQARQKVEDWREQVQRLKDGRSGCPQPLAWEEDD